MEYSNKVKAVVLGHAVADALGVPVEFESRKALMQNPVTDMRGYGAYPVPAGAWSDDTSMSLCALSAIAELGEIDFDAVMMNFCRWYYRDEFTPTGEMFDVGKTCSFAIHNYFVGKFSYTECGLTDERSNGNGSLMRIHPVVLYLHNKKMSIDDKIKIVEQASALTHAHDRSKIGCGIYAFILWELLDNPCKNSIIEGLKKAYIYYEKRIENSAYKRLYEKIGKLFSILESRQHPDVIVDEISSDGYVVHTLEAAVWCLLNSNSYKESVLKAVNLGDDTDTVGAVTGGLAGALYGYDAIPSNWLDKLIKREYIENLCAKFSDK